MKPPLQLCTLGDLSFAGADGKPRRIATRKARALAAYLAFHPGRRWARATLAELFWGDESEAAARHSLRQALSSIRQTLGAEVVMGDEDLVGIRQGEIRVDALEFERHVLAETLPHYEKAERLYRGDLHEGLEIGQRAFDVWVAHERARLKELARRNLGQILVHTMLDRDLNAALTTARRLISFDPFDEAAHRVVMTVYIRQGRRGEAIRHFEMVRGALRTELGVAPEDETVALFEAAREGGLAARRTGPLAEYVRALEQLPQCVIVTDLSNAVVGWNSLAEAEFGFSKSEMYGSAPGRLRAPIGDDSLSDEAVRTAITKGQWSKRVALKSKDGHVTHQTRTVVPLRDAYDRIVGAFGIGTPSE